MCADTLRDVYSRLPEDDQCQVLYILGQVACACDQEESGNKNSHDYEINTSSKQCSICNQSEISWDPKTVMDAANKLDLLPVLESLLRMPQTQSKRLGAVAMLSLRRLLLHTRDTQSLKLMSSAYGQWCLRGLQNPSRDVRIAAGFVLSA